MKIRIAATVATTRATMASHDARRSHGGVMTRRNGHRAGSAPESLAVLVGFVAHKRDECCWDQDHEGIEDVAHDDAACLGEEGVHLLADLGVRLEVGDHLVGALSDGHLEALGDRRSLLDFLGLVHLGLGGGGHGDLLDLGLRRVRPTVNFKPDLPAEILLLEALADEARCAQP